MKKGIFITIYGINNIGKSSQVELLVQKFEELGYDVKRLKYPIYDLAPTGPLINDILRGGNKQEISEEEFQTLFMKNREDFEPTLKRWLDDEFVVIAEDYTGSGIAWGAAKGMRQEDVERLNAHLLKEDLAILLEGRRHIEAKESSHIHESQDELVKKVDVVLHRLADKFGWKTVRTVEGIEESFYILWRVVEEFLEK